MLTEQDERQPQATCTKIGKVRPCGFWDMRVDRQTDNTHTQPFCGPLGFCPGLPGWQYTHHNTSHPSWGRSNDSTYDWPDHDSHTSPNTKQPIPIYCKSVVVIRYIQCCQNESQLHFCIQLTYEITAILLRPRLTQRLRARSEQKSVILTNNSNNNILTNNNRFGVCVSPIPQRGEDRRVTKY